jgi:crossover junction endodeoxyribonuclease RuvC
VLCLAAAQAGVMVHTLAHAHVKRALVGSGSARKDQVNAMVTHLLRLRTAPKPNDVSDALALALAFLNMHRVENMNGLTPSIVTLSGAPQARRRRAR